MKANWHLPNHVAPLPHHLWSDLISEILRARQIPESQWRDFLSPQFKDIRSPIGLKDIDRAVQRLHRAFLNGEKVCIYADFDLDGTSGLALLKTGFERLGFRDFVCYQPLRLSEGYGLHLNVVEDLAASGVKVLVTVDVGITANVPCARAKELGMDVIITDHHLPKKLLPEAFAVVNPNREDCSSGLGHLSGAGVAFYLLWALKEKWKAEKLSPPAGIEIKDLLDCFVIATLTDMVPLVNENRLLVRLGLKALEQTLRPGLKELLTRLNLSPKRLTSQDVAIRFAPKLNALSRLEKGIRPIDLYLVQDPVAAKDLVSRVIEQNSHRVDLQAQAEELALAMLEKWPHEQFIFLASDRFHKGVVGLVATRLSQLRNCPAFIGSVTSDEVIVGSARLPRGHMGSALDILAASREHLTRFGGHKGAAGFELPICELENAIEKMRLFFLTELAQPKTQGFEVDAKANFADMTLDFMDWFKLLEPFGQSFPAVHLLFENVEVLGGKWLKEDHLKLTLKQKGVQRDGLWFSAPKETGFAILEALKTRKVFVNLLAEPQINTFMQKIQVQLLIKDLEDVQTLEPQRGVFDQQVPF